LFRGFFSAMDAMWLMKQLESGKMSVLECLAERESIYRPVTSINICFMYAVLWIRIRDPLFF
jgi:hypothetical protein